MSRREASRSRTPKKPGVLFGSGRHRAARVQRFTAKHLTSAARAHKRKRRKMAAALRRRNRR